VQIRLFWKASGRNIKKHWYDVNFIYIDLSNISVKEVLEKIRPLTEGKSIFELLKAIFYAVKTVFAVDRINELARFTRCREINKGETDRIMTEFHNEIQKARGIKA